MSDPRIMFFVGGLVIVGALSYRGFVGFQESKAYYITVAEFHGTAEKYQGKTLKIAGDVVAGSVDRSKSPFEFTLAHEGKSLHVQYVGRAVIPDTFKDGAKAVVEGHIAASGIFQARHIEAKCASKYEAEYEKKAPIAPRTTS